MLPVIWRITQKSYKSFWFFGEFEPTSPGGLFLINELRLKVDLKKYFLIFLGLFVVSLHAIAASTNVAQIVNPLIKKFMGDNQIPGVAVELYVKGVPHSYYYGYADKQRKIKVEQNTIFELGSLTKLFTSLLVAQEVNAGVMKLNNSIVQYLPHPLVLAKSNLKQVTLKNLATHTASLPFDLSASITNQALISYFLHWTPSKLIGTQWRYSNIGFGLLGYALVNATHKNYDQLYDNNILQPLGMNAIAITVPHNLQTDYAQGYGIDGRAIHRVNMGLFPAAAGMKATAHDLLLFLSAAIGLPHTPSAIAKEMQITQTPYVHTHMLLQGLGWQIWPINQDNVLALLHPSATLETQTKLHATMLSSSQRLFDATALIDKTGATGGFRSYIAVIPADKSGIVILINRNISGAVVETVGRKILFKLNGLD